MDLSFLVNAQEDGLLLRDFMRKHHVSGALSTAVKADRGFFCRRAGVQDAIRANARVCAGDTILFALPPEPKTSVAPQRLPLDIVYEDAHVMLLNKPAGQAVHPTLGYADGTLANAFCGELAGRGLSSVFRPVNRIDRNTSGLVLCGMNLYAASVLAAQAAKVYYAVLEGVLPCVQGEIDAPIGLAEGSIIRRCVTPDGKPACTQYTVLAEGSGLSLVRAIPVTGRTHQLRVHFAHLGCPLAGDDLYGGSTAHIARHALHCGEISYIDPATGAPRTVQLPLAQDMADLVRRNLRFSALGIV